MKCTFCQIVNREKEEKKFQEWNHIVSFSDIKPAGDIHFLLIPKIHITDALELTEMNLNVLNEMKNISHLLLTKAVKL